MPLFTSKTSIYSITIWSWWFLLSLYFSAYYYLRLLKSPVWPDSPFLRPFTWFSLITQSYSHLTQSYSQFPTSVTKNRALDQKQPVDHLEWLIGGIILLALNIQFVSIASMHHCKTFFKKMFKPSKLVVWYFRKKLFNNLETLLFNPFCSIHKTVCSTLLKTFCSCL